MTSRSYVASLVIITLTTSLCTTSCNKNNAGCNASVDCGSVTFSGTIQPLAASTCALSGCHGGSFDSYANLSGLANNGSLMQQVVTSENMPAGNVSMSCEERAQVECWINAGAPNN